MIWLRDLICGPCECAEPLPPAVVPKAEIPVPPTSPARILAKSLTDPETRGEWEIAPGAGLYSIGYGSSTQYRNDKRNLTVSRWWGPYSGGGISTPFTLNKAEEKIVAEALTAWHKHRSDEAERAALARLTAQPGEAGTAETVKQGSARRASTGSAKRMRPKGNIA